MHSYCKDPNQMHVDGYLTLASSIYFTHPRHLNIQTDVTVAILLEGREPVFDLDQLEDLF